MFGDVKQPATLLAFGYANGNPLSYADPLGTAGFLDTFWANFKASQDLRAPPVYRAMAGTQAKAQMDLTKYGCYAAIGATGVAVTGYVAAPLVAEAGAGGAIVLGTEGEGAVVAGGEAVAEGVGVGGVAKGIGLGLYRMTLGPVVGAAVAVTRAGWDTLRYGGQAIWGHISELTERIAPLLDVGGQLTPALPGGGTYDEAGQYMSRYEEEVEQALAQRAAGRPNWMAKVGEEEARGGLAADEELERIRASIGEGPEAAAVRITGRSGAGMARLPRHHVFPDEERAFFEEHGFTGDLDIDQFTVEIEEASHQAIHTGRDKWEKEWNTRIMAALRSQEKLLGRKLTMEEVFAQARTLMKEYGIPPRFVPYEGQPE